MLSPCLFPPAVLVLVGFCVVSCILCYKCTPPPEEQLTGALLKGMELVDTYKGHRYRGILQRAQYCYSYIALLHFKTSI